MKKHRIFTGILCAVLCAALVFCLGGCRKDEKETTAGADETAFVTLDSDEETDTRETGEQTPTGDEAEENTDAEGTEKTVEDVRYCDGEIIYNIYTDDSGKRVISRTAGDSCRVEYVEAELFDRVVNDVLSYGFDRYGKKDAAESGVYCSLVYSDGTVLTVTPDDLPERGDIVFNTIGAELSSPFTESETAQGEILYPDAAG